jgi:hypothetical protein
VEADARRVGQRQDKLPVLRRIGRDIDDDGRGGDIDADFRGCRPLPPQRVEQRQGRRPATGGIHHQIGVKRLRTAGAVDKLDAARFEAAGCGHDPAHAAGRTQRDVCDRLDPSPQRRFDQRPRRTKYRDLEIALRQRADVRPLHLHIASKRNRDGARRREVALEIGEQLIERLKAAGEQAVRVAVLRRAGTRSGGCRKSVALEDVNLFEKGANAPAADSPPIPAPITTARRPTPR